MTGLPPWAQQLVEDNRLYLISARGSSSATKISLVITQQAAAMAQQTPDWNMLRCAEFGIGKLDTAVRLRVFLGAGDVREWAEVEQDMWVEKDPGLSENGQFNIKPTPRRKRTDDLNAYAESLSNDYRKAWFGGLDQKPIVYSTSTYQTPGVTRWPTVADWPMDDTKLRFMPTEPTKKQANPEPAKPPESLAKTPNGRCIRLNLDKE